jgi:hypothetical protein
VREIKVAQTELGHPTSIENTKSPMEKAMPMPATLLPPRRAHAFQDRRADQPATKTVTAAAAIHAAHGDA